MGILYAISILAFAALLWAALSIARHVRDGHAVEEPVQPAPRKIVVLERPYNGPEPKTPRSERPFEFFDPREFRNHPTQTTQQFPTSLKPAPSTPPSVAQELQTHELPIHGVRRLPRQVSSRGSDRLDWAYFNKDLGDLNDPEAANRPRSTTRPNIKQA